MPFQLGSALKVSHQVMSAHLTEGDIVIDGTMGKGRDTLFLSRLVGESGKVFSFDIQESALKQTLKLLNTNSHPDNVKLIHDNHENVHCYVMQPISGAMFNLGYLPGGDHAITTLAHSTIAAIKSCMDLLLPGGLITVCVYYGHQQGRDEKYRLLEFCDKVDPGTYSVAKLEFINQINEPPMLLLIQKNKKIIK